MSAEDLACWTHLAATTVPWKFRQLVARAIEEAKQGKPTKRLELFVTESAVEDFGRVKVLLRRKTKRVLTDGQVFALLVRRFVESEDTGRRGLGWMSADRWRRLGAQLRSLDVLEAEPDPQEVFVNLLDASAPPLR